MIWKLLLACIVLFQSDVDDLGVSGELVFHWMPNITMLRGSPNFPTANCSSRGIEVRENARQMMCKCSGVVNQWVARGVPRF